MRSILIPFALMLAGPALGQGFVYRGTDITIEGFSGQQDTFVDIDTEGGNIRTSTDLGFGDFGLQVDLSHMASSWGGSAFLNNSVSLIPYYQFSPNAKAGIVLTRTELSRFADAPAYEPFDEYGLAVLARVSPNLDVQAFAMKSDENDFTSRATRSFEVAGRYRFSEQWAARADVFAGEISVPAIDLSEPYRAAGLGIEYSMDNSAFPVTWYASVEYTKNDFWTREETRLRLGAVLHFGSDQTGLPKFERRDYFREMMSFD